MGKIEGGHRFSKILLQQMQKRIFWLTSVINYENPNEELPGEGLILVENGEYLCRECNNVMAIYRIFK